MNINENIKNREKWPYISVTNRPYSATLVSRCFSKVPACLALSVALESLMFPLKILLELPVN